MSLCIAILNPKREDVIFLRKNHAGEISYLLSLL